MYRKKLTGWLILLIAWIGVFGFSGGARSLSTIESEYRPYMADYPSLRTAVMVFQLLVGAGVAAWVYTAWTLYRREPGTLTRAQRCLLLGALLRVAGSYSIALFGGMPREAVSAIVRGALPLTLFIFMFTGIWYTYLARSPRVREIYAGEPPMERTHQDTHA